MIQLDLFEAREAGMHKAELSANEVWKRHARDAIELCARTLDGFTTDDILDYLKRFYPHAHTHNLMALGPMVRNAAKSGLIYDTGGKRRSPRNHRDLTVWSAA